MASTVVLCKTCLKRKSFDGSWKNLTADDISAISQFKHSWEPCTDHVPKPKTVDVQKSTITQHIPFQKG